MTPLHRTSRARAGSASRRQRAEPGSARETGVARTRAGRAPVSRAVRAPNRVSRSAGGAFGPAERANRPLDTGNGGWA